MDLSALSYFVKICETKNISRAADSLFLTRQALSHAIKAMEEELGTKLLERKRTGIELTEEGACLYKNSVALLDIWKQTLDGLDLIKRTKKETIRAGFGLMTFHLWDIDHAERFMLTHPNVNMEVTAMVADQLWPALMDQQLDVIITRMLREDERVHSVILQRRTMFALMSKDDALAEKEVISPADMEGKTIFLTPGNTYFEDKERAFFMNQKVNVEIQHCPSDDVIALLRLIQNKSGVYFSSGAFRQYISDMDGLTMKPVAPEWNMPNKDIYAVTLKERENDALLAEYIQYLKEQGKKGVKRAERP